MGVRIEQPYAQQTHRPVPHRRHGPFGQTECDDAMSEGLPDEWEYVQHNPARRRLVVGPEGRPYNGIAHEWSYTGR